MKNYIITIGIISFVYYIFLIFSLLLIPPKTKRTFWLIITPLSIIICPIINLYNLYKKLK